MGIARRDFKSDDGKASRRGVIDAEARDANWVKRPPNLADCRLSTFRLRERIARIVMIYHCYKWAVAQAD